MVLRLVGPTRPVGGGEFKTNLKVIVLASHLEYSGAGKTIRLQRGRRVGFESVWFGRRGRLESVSGLSSPALNEGVEVGFKLVKTLV